MQHVVKGSFPVAAISWSETSEECILADGIPMVECETERAS